LGRLSTEPVFFAVVLNKLYPNQFSRFKRPPPPPACLQPDVIIQELEAGAAYTATVSAFNKKGTSLVRHILIETLQPPESQLVEEKLAHQAGGGDGGGSGGGDLGWQLGGGVLAGVILSLVLITGRRAWRGLASDGLIDLRVDRTTKLF
jgi:hypothetical protein